MSPAMITLGGYRYPLARYRPLGWTLLLLLAAVANQALPWPWDIVPPAAMFVTGIVVLVDRMTRDEMPPFFSLIAAALWLVVVILVGVNPYTIGVLLAGGIGFGWRQVAGPGPWRVPVPYPAPIEYTSAGGAVVRLYPPRPGVRKDRWWWECTGCLKKATAEGVDVDLRDDADGHRVACGASPYPELP